MPLFKIKKAKKPSKQSSCAGKSKMTEAIARAKAKSIRARGAKMYAYRCVYCKLPNGNSSWHIGHRR